METHHVLLFCFLSALCGGNTGIVSAQIPIYTGAEGGNASLGCGLSPIGSMKFFCREQCQEGNILIKTAAVTGTSGRYSLTFINDTNGRQILVVAFTNMAQSDSGLYRCGFGTSSGPYSYWDFEIRVSVAPFNIIDGQNATIPCNNTVSGSRFIFCKNMCIIKEDFLINTTDITAQTGRYIVQYVQGSLSTIITQVTTSDTGWYWCGYGSPSSLVSVFPMIVVDAPTHSSVSQPPYLWPLVVCVSLVAVLLLAAFLFYKWKTKRNLGGNSSGHKDATETRESVVYENYPSGRTHEDSLYEGIDPATRDQDYCTITNR
ncbi:polymeric immunoglobulin receptor-like [Anabas testudineus]|uniref:polymeric immunoglobulin receptor-like n=1 Tax=Anabas testudineus TaxID=64144 RepID=UPI000E4604DA|nr:polymeric immunoglobulin receptor-like [Anabas testudineus]